MGGRNLFFAKVFVALKSLAAGEDQALHKDIVLGVYEKVQEPVHSCLIIDRPLLYSCTTSSAHMRDWSRFLCITGT